MEKKEHEKHVVQLRAKYQSELGKYNSMMDYLDLALFEGEISKNDHDQIVKSYN